MHCSAIENYECGHNIDSITVGLPIYSRYLTGGGSGGSLHAARVSHRPFWAMSAPDIVHESGFPFHRTCDRTRVGIAGIGAIFILKYSPIEL